MKKTFLGFILMFCVLSILFVFLPITASADVNDIYTYTIIDGKAIITACDTSVSGVIEIPSTLGEYPVTTIGERAFSYCTGLTGITIPDSITSIENFAFYSCSNLTEIYWNAKNVADFTSDNCIFGYAGNDGDGISVIFGDNVEKIPAYAFCPSSSLSMFAPKITSITIGHNVSSIGIYAFFHCKDLIEIHWNAKNVADFTSDNCIFAFVGQNDKGINVMFGDNVEKIPAYAFYPGSNSHYTPQIISVTIGNGVTSIGAYAFSRCTHLASITIGNSVTSIGIYAFYYCIQLEKVEIYDLEAWCKIDFGIADANPLSYGEKLYLNGELITDLVIPETLTSIGDFVFENCKSITTLTIPNGITDIGDSAFKNCTYLRNVTIPNSVGSIGKEAFYNCTRIRRVDISELDAWCKIVFNGVASNPLYYGENLYLNSEHITDLVISDKITSIGNYSFSGYEGLKSVIIGNSVTSIGNHTFYNCSGLTGVTIGDSVTTVNKYAFYNCTGLIQINWNAKNVSDFASSNYIFAYAGQDGDGITVTFGNKVENIPAYVFYPYSRTEYIPKITSIIIGENVTNIGKYAFGECKMLTQINWNAKNIEDLPSNNYTFSKAGQNVEGISITFGNVVEKIPSFAFCPTSNEDYTPNIISVIMGENITTIGDYAFYNCTGIANITIPENVTSIGDYAFYNFTGLTRINWNAKNVTDFTSEDNVFAYAGQAGEGIDVIFGDNVEQIPAYVFYSASSTECTPKIKNLTFGNNVTSIGNYAFYNCKNLIQINWNAKKVNDFTSEDYIFACAGQNDDGISVIFGNIVEKIPAYAFFGYLPKITNVAISDSITSIGDYAFYNCSGISGIIIGKNVDSIGDYAFSHCIGLTNINTGDSVTRIGNGAFYSCTGLKNVIIGNNVSSIGNSAFGSCSGLESVSMGDNVGCIGNSAFSSCSALISLNIGDSVTSIGDYAFSHCTGLANINISDSVTNIGNHAFYYCSALSSITIGDSVTTIGNYAFYYCKNLIQINWNAKNVTDFSSGNYIFSYAGQNVKGVSVMFGDNVEQIPAYLFCPSSNSNYTPKIINVTIGDSLRSIGDCAFYNCLDIIKVNVTDIGAWCNIIFGFYANPLYYAKNLYHNEMLVTNLDIPDNVITISGEAFWGCTSLESITIHKDTTNISNSAFEGCSALTDVYYYGTESEWKEVYIGANNLSVKNAAIHYMKHTRTSFSDDGKMVSVTPINIKKGKTVIFALYYNDKLVRTQSALYEGEQLIFIIDKTYTNAKVVVWDNMTNIKPVCDVEFVK